MKVENLERYLVENNILTTGTIQHGREYLSSNGRLIPQLNNVPESLLLIGEVSDDILVRAHKLMVGTEDFVSTKDYNPTEAYAQILPIEEQVELQIMLLNLDTISKRIVLGTANTRDVAVAKARSIVNKRLPGFEVITKRVFYTSYFKAMEQLHKLVGAYYDNSPIQVPIEERLQTVFRNAVELGATDISLEPYSEGMEIWYAIGKNWSLYPHIKFKKEETENVSNWITTAADVASNAAYQPLINCALKSLGRIDNYRGRVNKFQAYYGPVLNIRVLPNEPEFIDIDRLSYTDVMSSYVKDISKWREGIVLITGETNSGKNTTIFGIVSQMVSKKRYKTLSLENPIEYLVPKVIQIEADTPSAYTQFSESLLRQSPDIVYYSEISTPSIAENVVSTAITGKFVVSTLHASSASQIFNRMSDMLGYNATTKLASYLIGVINQKLLPKSCPDCQEEIDVDDIDPRYGEVLKAKGYVGAVYVNTGKTPDGDYCHFCKGLGVKGIIPVAEYIDFDPELKKKLRISQNDLETQSLLEEVMEEKEITMLDDALRVMERGDVSITTLIDRNVLDIKTRGMK